MRKSFATLPSLLLGLAFSLCLPGCASSKRPVVASIPVPPAERLRCADEPRVPIETTDASVAGYIVDLAAAGQSCRSAVTWLRDWARAVNAPKSSAVKSR